MLLLVILTHDGLDDDNFFDGVQTTAEAPRGARNGHAARKNDPWGMEPGLCSDDVDVTDDAVGMYETRL